MDLDRQSIERRDFPMGRRGYDPAAVDAHLRAVAAEVSAQRSRGGNDASLASAAGTQVQSILEAAEAAAKEIERAALDNARQVREAADRDAEKTRDDALEKARAHVAAVSQATAGLLEHVGSMDTEVSGLIESLRAGTGRLAADLQKVESGMSDLYGVGTGSAAAARQAQPDRPAPKFEEELEAATAGEPSAAAKGGKAAPDEEADDEEGSEGAASQDVDGARLIALNMALNGESRADTERYLAENFQIENRLQLIDEVYAAIES